MIDVNKVNELNLEDSDTHALVCVFNKILQDIGNLVISQYSLISESEEITDETYKTLGELEYSKIEMMASASRIKMAYQAKMKKEQEGLLLKSHYNVPSLRES